MIGKGGKPPKRVGHLVNGEVWEVAAVVVDEEQVGEHAVQALRLGDWPRPLPSHCCFRRCITWLLIELYFV